MYLYLILPVHLDPAARALVMEDPLTASLAEHLQAARATEHLIKPTNTLRALRTFPRHLLSPCYGEQRSLFPMSLALYPLPHHHNNFFASNPKRSNRTFSIFVALSPRVY